METKSTKIKEQNTTCKHIKRVTVKKVNPSMYYGYEISSKCYDCGNVFYHFRVEINYILELLAESLHKEMVTAEDLVISGWIYPVPSVKEANDLIKNRFKFL